MRVVLALSNLILTDVEIERYKMSENASNDLEWLLRNMVTSLVDDVNKISIRTHDSESTVFFDVDVDRDDVGKLIGREGKTAGALRHILGAAGAKYKVRTILSIKDKKSDGE